MAHANNARAGERAERVHRRAPGRRLRLRDIDAELLTGSARRFFDHHLNDWAAALTFYAGISLLPALLIVIAILGIAGESTLENLQSNLSGRADGPVSELALEAIDQVSTSALGAGLALVVGVLGALWSASSYVGGFMRAAGVIHGRAERYPVWKLRPLQLALTAATIVAIAGTALVVVITGPLAAEIASLVGLESAVAEIWDLAKWPLVIAFVLGIFAVLYWAAPDVRKRGLQWLTPGGILATAAWVIGSVAYAVYVELFADYSGLYGSLGAVVGFLIWLWLSNIAMLFGVELNAHMEQRADERGRADGQPEPASSRPRSSA